MSDAEKQTSGLRPMADAKLGELIVARRRTQNPFYPEMDWMIGTVSEAQDGAIMLTGGYCRNEAWLIDLFEGHILLP